MFVRTVYAYEEMFHDLHENNVASALFEQSCDTSPWATKENIARSAEVKQSEAPKRNAQIHGRRNLKDTNPLMSSLLVTLFGVLKQYCRF
jgi:hypothetical protein